MSKYKGDRLLSNSAINSGIKRCRKRIAQAKRKLKFSKLDSDKDAARECIKHNESKILRLEQQLLFNELNKVKGDI